MNAGWMIPFIILGGALQSCSAAMNGHLNKSLVNPWLASAVSFATITFFFSGVFFAAVCRFYGNGDPDRIAAHRPFAATPPPNMVSIRGKECSTYEHQKQERPKEAGTKYQTGVWQEETGSELPHPS